MFTGIIQSIGKIEKANLDTNEFIINTKLDLSDCKVGSSICCDGVCLTAKNIFNEKSYYNFEVNIGEETMKRSNLIDWNIDSIINIEKSLRLGDEISGHFVYGHIDTTIKVLNINELQNSWEFEFSMAQIDKSLNLKNYIIEKGSIAINGISLTIANVFEQSFNVSIIPHTFVNTNLSNLRLNDKVNIEFDPLARYISNRYAK